MSLMQGTRGVQCCENYTTTHYDNRDIDRIRIVKRVSDYELYMSCENSEKKRVSPFVVALLSFGV